MSEKVLVFPTANLDYLGTFRGVIKGDLIPRYLQLLHPSMLFYLSREQAEQDPNFLQVIPYCVLKDGDNIFRYQRTKKGGEARLHDKWSIGVGGHINPVDVVVGVLQDTYQTALERELAEEVSLQGTYRNTIIGCLYDPSNDVGRVHFGIVHLLELDPGYSLGFNDPALAGGDFMPVAYVKNHLDQFENWSRLVLEQLL